MFRPPFTILQLLACLAVAAWTQVAAAEPVRPVYRVLMERTSPPFASVNAEGKAEGFVVELMEGIAADQGLKVEFDLRPWQQVYADFQQGRGDVLGLVAYSEERARLMDFSISYETLHCAVYVRKSSPGITGPAQLGGLRVGVIHNSIVEEFVRKQGWHVTLVPFDSLLESLHATQRGDIDATMSMQFVTDYLIRSTGIKGLDRAEFVPAGLQYTLCYAVQPGQKELLARINEGMTQVRRNGTYNRLFEKWLGPLEPQQLRWRDVQPFLPLLTALAVATLGIFVWQRRLLHRLSRQAHELREREQQLQLVFEGSQDAFWDWDVPTGRVLRSPRWTGMLGYRPDEVRLDHQSFIDLVHPDDRALVQSHNDRVRHPEQDHFVREMRMRAKNGEWMWILDRGKVVARDPATGAPLRIAGTHTDITARKRAEAEADKLQHKMEEAQKLESLGVLAGGIAHDFNNLLTVILGNSTLARLESAESPANQARLDAVVTSAHRAAELCHQLLAYAGKGSYSIDRINLNSMVTETTRLLELSISKQAKLEFNLAPVLPRIEADPTQIRQVIMNLVINASEALTDRPGIIRISTRVVTLPPVAPDDSASPTDIAPGDYVLVEVADTGSGMTPEVLARIFDPFFTTKFTGRGLGLAAVIGIVRTHRGTLKVESTPGQGSMFRIYLPVSQTQTAHPFGATVVQPVV